MRKTARHVRISGGKLAHAWCTHVIGRRIGDVLRPWAVDEQTRSWGGIPGPVRTRCAKPKWRPQEAVRRPTTAGIRLRHDRHQERMEKLIGDPVGVTPPSAASVSSNPAAPPSDPTGPAPTDPVALGTAPVAPVTPAPLPDVSVPMPELPPPPESKDFAAPGMPPAPKPAPEPAQCRCPEGPGGRRNEERRTRRSRGDKATRGSTDELRLAVIKALMRS